jgi:hypothetical protein
VPVIARRHAPEILQSAEHALDGVAIAVEERREAILPFSVGLGRDVGHRAVFLDLPTDRIRVVTLVGVQDLAGRKPSEKLRAGRAIGNLAACEHEREWPALRILQCMDLRRPPAARATDRLVFLPPFPPEAERCAFTAELSINTCSGGPPACASAWNRST